jgi:hypothetical protein
MAEQNFHATLSEFHALIESVAWRDMRSEVDTWLQEIRNKLEVEDDIGEIKRFQGIAEACRHFINLPQSICDAIEENVNGREF